MKRAHDDEFRSLLASPYFWIGGLVSVGAWALLLWIVL